MAKILIKLSEDKRSNLKIQWLPGDIISIQDDDFVFGDCECPPIFDIVAMDIPKGQRRQFIGPWANADGSIYRSSLWRWDLINKKLVRKSDGIERVAKDFK
jgi:hypothetical protein